MTVFWYQSVSSCPWSRCMSWCRCLLQVPWTPDQTAGHVQIQKSFMSVEFLSQRAGYFQMFAICKIRMICNFFHLFLNVERMNFNRSVQIIPPECVELVGWPSSTHGLSLISQRRSPATVGTPPTSERPATHQSYRSEDHEAWRLYSQNKC